ncbi:hypothetical protein N7453_003385 [Penicillium expansum]|nr:hypothetical protein N7453_003385 [Penicillium expansum]
MSRIENLPTELILLIASFLRSESSLAAVVLSNRRLYGICTRRLYQYNALHGNSSVLEWAAQNGRMDTLEMALDAGVPLPKEQPKGERRHGGTISQFGREGSRLYKAFQPHPISLAVRAGHADIVRYMICHGVTSNMRDPDGFSLLALAAIHGDVSLARYLLDVGSCQGIRSFVGHRPVWLAAFQGHVDVVDMLLLAPKQNEDEPDKEELMTDALIAAVLGEQVQVVQLLFTHGVQVNVLGHLGQSPLFIAASRGMSDFVSLLLAYGADPNLIVERRNARAPLTAAVMKDHEEIVRMLVRRTVSHHRTRALAYALSSPANIRLAKILLQSGAPPQLCPSDIADDDEDWVQPLVYAARGNDLEVVELLLEYGADANVRWSKESPYEIHTPFNHALLWAVDESKEAMVNLLLKGGADPDVTDMAGQPVLAYAVYSQHEGILRSLLDHGANPFRAMDDCGRKLLGFWPMNQSFSAQLQEAEAKWTKQHQC